MDLVKTTAQTHQIDPTGQKEFKGLLSIFPHIYFLLFKTQICSKSYLFADIPFSYCSCVANKC